MIFTHTYTHFSGMSKCQSEEQIQPPAGGPGMGKQQRQKDREREVQVKADLHVHLYTCTYVLPSVNIIGLVQYWTN